MGKKKGGKKTSGKKKGKGTGKKSKNKKAKSVDPPPPTPKTVLPWEEDAWTWMGKSSYAAQRLRSEFRKRYVATEYYPICTEVPWRALLGHQLAAIPRTANGAGPADDDYDDAETMVKLIMMMVRHEGDKRIQPDDVHVVAASIRQQNGADNLRRMHRLMRVYVAKLDGSPDVADLLAVVDSFDLNKITWGPPYDSVPKRYDLVMRLRALRWTAGDRILHHARWGDRQEHLASVLQTIEAVVGSKGQVSSQSAGAETHEVDAVSASVNLAEHGVVLLDDPTRMLDYLTSFHKEESRWLLASDAEKENVLKQLLLHQQMFERARSHGHILCANHAREIGLHDKVEDDVLSLFEDDSALQVLWAAMAPDGSERLSSLEVMSYISRKYVGLVHREALKHAYDTVVAGIDTSAGEGSGDRGWRADLTRPHFKLFLWRMLCYNRVLAAFTKADINGDGLLDRQEWSEGSEELSQMLQVQCNGTTDEFDDVLRVAPMSTSPPAASASPLSASTHPNSDGGEALADSDSTNGIAFEDLCEWCVVKLRSDDGLASGSKIALYADVFEELWEPVAGPYAPDVLAFDTEEQVMGLVMHCHYSTRA